MTLHILKKLHDSDLPLNLDKCTFKVEEVDYLRMVVRENQIKMDPTKLTGICNWPTPTSVKQVQSFLEFENLYQWFIGHYGDIAWPLNDLTKKDKTWDWSEGCQKAFDKLKEEFLKPSVLLMSNVMRPSTVESDALKWATGAVFQQQDMNGEWHTCGLISHSFDATQQNYKIYDRELFEIVCALETWHHYLQGSSFSTVILSDHKNLTYFQNAQKLNQ